MPPKRRATVSTQRKITDSGLKTSKKRRVIQKPIDLTKSLVKPEKKARSTSPIEDIAPITDDDELQKEDEIVHTGIDDDLEIRKRRQPAAKPKVIEIHTKDQSKEDKVLRAFDLNYAYGSCVGITRLERWQRADKLGLNPPQEVKKLLAGKNADKEDVKECLFHGRV